MISLYFFLYYFKLGKELYLKIKIAFQICFIVYLNFIVFYDSINLK